MKKIYLTRVALFLVLALCMSLVLVPAAAQVGDGFFVIKDGTLQRIYIDTSGEISPGTIGDFVYVRCTSLTDVTIPDGVTSIGNNAFDSRGGLTSVTIPDGVTSIGGSAFFRCTGLTSVTIPSSVTSIGFWAFHGTPWLESQEGEFVTINGILLAYQGNDSSVTIPNSVTSIGAGVFFRCTDLTSVTIPDSVTSIGNGAFEGCTGLTDVYYGGSEEQWNAIQIDGNRELINATIHFSGTMTEAPTVPGASTAGGFADVPVYEYYAQPVLWAVDRGITVGTGDGTTFSPEDTCTHIQIITFLWRAAGRLGSDVTAPVSASLGGVEDYVNAANWAYGKGIIGDDFNPDTPCTRADTVYYMWKYDGSNMDVPASSFTDVSISADYRTAVDWAVAEKVTEGTDPGVFSPDEICTRGQIVTFLYRAFA